MKISINSDTKKIYVKGDTKGQPIKEFLDKFFLTEDWDEYQISTEEIKYQYPPLTKEITTTMGQAEG